MTISYNWLSTYLPEEIEPEKLSRILTAVGLEVESLERYESIPGGLQGLLVGEVLTCEKHPDADKLTLTTVNVGAGDPLPIVCGAANVAVGQKVVVAPVGATIYPLGREPMTMKKAKIRGQESHGMICAEDEIGFGESHEGIMVLNEEAIPGSLAADYFEPYTDWIYEIGLTPNRMDAMSHLGVARDVCAYMVHHEKKKAVVKSPLNATGFAIDDASGKNIKVTIENPDACALYAGVCITGVKVAESPVWLKNRLRSIGLRPISNIVDITNFILHETGQPLHAFDAAQIGKGEIRVKNLPGDTVFVSLDEKERKLFAEDLMICDGNDAPLCIGGVFGGLHSGVGVDTTDIFLESAWFHPVSIRKSSVRHGLRTDAAARFEKGVDISKCVSVLKRAALLVKELAGGKITGKLVEEYPNPKEKTQVALKYHYLKKLSGKNYHPDAVKRILESLGFEFIKEGNDDLWFAVPYHKPDVTMPADVVEEIMRIDGLDNVEIPAMITLAPSADPLSTEELWREKLSDYLVGLGFHEILTNAITNSKYYTQDQLAGAVKMMNNLSADLDIMRPSMLESGLETLVHNLNRRNRDLRLFELGKTYSTTGVGKYAEQRHLCLWLAGQVQQAHWQQKGKQGDFFYLKGVISNLLQLAGGGHIKNEPVNSEYGAGLAWMLNGKTLATLIQVSTDRLRQFDIKQPVWFGQIEWDLLLEMINKVRISYTEIPKFPGVERDLALVVDTQVKYEQLTAAVNKASLPKLQKMNLFDVFESEKLGQGKKSMALNFVFQDNEKTMTDHDIDKMMQELSDTFTRELNAEIRK